MSVMKHFAIFLIMFVCAFKKVSITAPKKDFFLIKKEWVSMILGVLHLGGQQSCIMGLKITTILSPFFSKNCKTLNIGMWGVYPKAMVWNIALHTHISLWVSVPEE